MFEANLFTTHSHVAATIVTTFSQTATAAAATTTMSCTWSSLKETKKGKKEQRREERVEKRKRKGERRERDVWIACHDSAREITEEIFSTYSNIRNCKTRETKAILSSLQWLCPSRLRLPLSNLRCHFLLYTRLKLTTRVHFPRRRNQSCKTRLVSLIVRSLIQCTGNKTPELFLLYDCSTFCSSLPFFVLIVPNNEYISLPRILSGTVMRDNNSNFEVWVSKIDAGVLSFVLVLNFRRYSNDNNNKWSETNDVTSVLFILSCNTYYLDCKCWFKVVVIQRCSIHENSRVYFSIRVSAQITYVKYVCCVLVNIAQ